jgi:hypothetical protein
MIVVKRIVVKIVKMDNVTTQLDNANVQKDI